MVSKRSAADDGTGFRRLLYYWALSSRLARKHYGNVSLFTDDLGEEVLVKAAGIKFTSVSKELNNVQLHHSNWTGGKIHTYLIQDRPFFHLDYDVLMWKPLPERIIESQAFVQNKEFINDVGISWAYPLAEFRKYVKWRPAYYDTFALMEQNFGYNVGVIGGIDYRAFNRYASDIIDILRHEKNKDVFVDDWMLKTAEGNKYIIILLEQYGLSAFLRYHGIETETVFDTFSDFADAAKRKSAGYEHLLSQVKFQENVAERIEAFMQKNMHRTYKRINSLVEKSVVDFVTRQAPAHA